MILGVDPGMVITGLALLDCSSARSPRLVWWDQVKGATGASKDFGLATRAANAVGLRVMQEARRHAVDAVVVESFTDQGSARRARTHGSWLAVNVCQAIWCTLHADGLADRVYWQTNEPALSVNKGTGSFVDAARFGRLPMVQPTPTVGGGGCRPGKYGERSVPEHAADAFGHALYFHDQGGRLGAMMR